MTVLPAGRGFPLVFEFLDEMLEAMPIPASLRRLVARQLDAGRRQAEEQPLAAAELPLLVCGGVTGDPAIAVPVAGACTLLYLGADLFDNIADAELAPAWEAEHQSQVALAAATLLAPMPYLAVQRLQAPDALRWQIGQELTATLVAMSAGQHEDLTYTGRHDVTLEQARLVAEGKGGEEYRGFARAAAVLGGADSRTVRAYGEFAAAAGTADQILSDLADVWDPDGNDLRNGTRTLPVVHALQGQQRGDAVDLHTLLDRARTSVAARQEVRQRLLQSGSVRYTTLIVEVYRQRALGALAEAAPRPPVAAALLHWADQLSVLHRAPAA